jgi:hypothetical protein
MEILSIKETKAALCVRSDETVEELVASGLLPYIEGRGGPEFLWPDIERFLVVNTGMSKSEATRRIADALWPANAKNKA